MSFWLNRMSNINIIRVSLKLIYHPNPNLPIYTLQCSVYSIFNSSGYSLCSYICFQQRLTYHLLTSEAIENSAINAQIICLTFLGSEVNDYYKTISTSLFYFCITTKAQTLHFSTFVSLQKRKHIAFLFLYQYKSVNTSLFYFCISTKA